MVDEHRNRELAAALRELLAAAEARAGRAVRRAGLARRIGVSASSLYAYLNGTTLIPLDVLHRLLPELGASAEETARLRRLRNRRAGAGAGAPAAVPALPLDAGSFIGRAAQLAELDRLRGRGGAVVISAVSGIGGIGKTALAVRWAHLRRGRFPDGVLCVDLRGFHPDDPVAPADALAALLRRLGVAEAGIPAGLDERIVRYQRLLVGRRVLLLLDNAFSAAQVRPLLPPGNSACFVVITSRDRLHGLVVTHGAHPLPLDVLSAAESRELLAARLGRERLAADPVAVADILAACAGLPLALRITAGRAQADPGVPLAALAAELRAASTRLTALADKDAAVSLPVVLSWTLAALTPEQERVFGLLGIAPGPDISEAAVASLAGSPPEATAVALRALEQLNLVQRTAGGRCRMHDLVRLHARAHCLAGQSAAERERALARLIDFYLHTARAGNWLIDPRHAPCALDPPAPGCRPLSLPGRKASWAWFTAERLCLQAAQQQALELGWHRRAYLFGPTQESVLRMRFSPNMEPFWRVSLLAATALADIPAMALAHGYLARLLTYTSRPHLAETHLPAALELAEQSGDRFLLALTHTICAETRTKGEQDWVAGLAHTGQALELFREIGSDQGVVGSRINMGWYLAELGRYAEALAVIKMAVPADPEHEDTWREADRQGVLGYIAHRTGKHGQAIRHYRAAARRLREVGNEGEEIAILGRLAESYLALGQVDAARGMWCRVRAWYRQQGIAEQAERVRRRIEQLGGDAGTTGATPGRRGG